MRIIYFNTISFINKHLKDYPSPKNLGYFWNFGSLLGIALTIQILTGIFLAMYYTPHINLAFLSVESIMRDVQGGWFLWYLHSNTASFYFFFIYLHILKALLFKSYHKQNTVLWFSGIIIFFLLAGTAFLGYVYCRKAYINCDSSKDWKITFKKKVIQIKDFIKEYIIHILLFNLFISLILKLWLKAMLTLLIVFIVYLKRIPYVKSILDQYKTDQETIAYHWKTDKDLLVVKKLSVLNIIVIFFLYLTLVFLNKNIDISNINNIMECTEVYWFSKIFDLLLFLFYSNVLVIYLYQVHIIFFRNMPTKQKVISFVGTTVKIIVPAAIISVPLIDMSASFMFSEPTNLTREYSKLAQGYCPNNLAVKTKLDILRGSKVFWENEEAFKASLSNKTVFEEDIARLIKKNPKLYDNLSLAQKARYNSL